MADRSSKLQILVLGYIVRGPLGGLAWHHLQYVIGLHRLGHDVYFLEDSEDYAACYDPTTDSMSTDPTYGLRFAGKALDRVGLGDRWAYYDAHSNEWLGPCSLKAQDICSGADCLINLSGVNPLRDWLMTVPQRVFVDTDPVFTQIRHLTDPHARHLAARHTSFFTFGENFGWHGCAIPDDGFGWIPTRQPVTLELWRAHPPNPSGKFTTVMQWDSYRAVEYGGISFGMKSASFGPYMDLPMRTGQSLELAVGSETAPRDYLLQRGWSVLDPRGPTVDPWTYQDYIARSKAEFGVAKDGYVRSWSGWFGERSAAYLASGRPVVVQDTGFTRWLAADGGVVPFVDPEQALAGLESIAKDLAGHSRKAREIAEAFFDSDVVLTSLLDRAHDSTRWSPV